MQKTVLLKRQYDGHAGDMGTSCSLGPPLGDPGGIWYMNYTIVLCAKPCGFVEREGLVTGVVMNFLLCILDTADIDWEKFGINIR